MRTAGTVAVALLSISGGGQVWPLVQGTEVTFVVDGTPDDPPRIVADFNGWTGGEMTPGADGRRYTLHVRLDPAARIEYLVAYRDRYALDPGNPRTVAAPAGPPRSELRMPEYRLEVPKAAPRARGTVEEMPFTSRSGERRRIRVYVPAFGRRPLPVLYVYDGDIVFHALALPSMLDALIDSGTIAPAFVVFVDAIDRHDDYEPGSVFRTAFAGEIVPTVERRYPVDHDRRALLGLSRSAGGALDACANAGLVFDACAVLAPAVPRHLDEVLPASGSRTRFLIAAGTYDVPLIADAGALRRSLEDHGAVVQYLEAPEGHNHTAFRARLPQLLQDLYPPR